MGSNPTGGTSEHLVSENGKEVASGQERDTRTSLAAMRRSLHSWTTVRLIVSCGRLPSRVELGSEPDGEHRQGATVLMRCRRVPPP